MDLAKIRQKARQEREIHTNDALVVFEEKQTHITADSLKQQEPILPEILQKVDSNNIAPTSTLGSAFFERQKQTPVTEQPTFFVPPVRDPIAVLLAGRTAAGCDEDLPLASTEIDEQSVSEYLEFLCFRVFDELYGINIMDIKEIIKPRETTEVPRSPAFVSGIISLRGTIIPIIDMRDRLGLKRDTMTGRERVIVVKFQDSFTGLVVDEVVHVVRIPLEAMEMAPAVLDGIDRDFVSSIGRADGAMIIILNCETIADITLF